MSISKRLADVERRKRHPARQLAPVIIGATTAAEAASIVHEITGEAPSWH